MLDAVSEQAEPNQMQRALQIAIGFATRRDNELEQIQFLLGHASVLTTERYLGCRQDLGHE
jgi:hypothetical protein